MSIFKKIDGSLVQLGNVLSRGGEGIVYEVPSSPYSVAKMWREASEAQTRKLEVLINHPPSLPAGVMSRFELAWPSEALYDDTGVMQGYLMPKVALEECRELVNYCIPTARRMMEQELGTQVGKQELLTIARNLSELFGCLHDAGYVIGDVNHTNFLVRRDGKLFMIDIDSVQATDPDSGDTYRCTVGKEDFTPPRLMGQRFDEVDRVAEDDLFGLSVLVFQLLMGGSHPYDPVDQTGGQGQVRRENIIRGHSPYANLDVVQAKAILDLENIPDPAIRQQQRENILAIIGLGATADFDTVLGPRISSWLELESEFQELFRRAFVEGEDARPNSAQWMGAIDAIRRNVRLTSPQVAPQLAAAPRAVAPRPAPSPMVRRAAMSPTAAVAPRPATRQPLRTLPTPAPRTGQRGQLLRATGSNVRPSGPPSPAPRGMQRSPMSSARYKQPASRAAQRRSFSNAQRTPPRVRQGGSGAQGCIMGLAIVGALVLIIFFFAFSSCASQNVVMSPPQLDRSRISDTSLPADALVTQRANREIETSSVGFGDSAAIRSSPSNGDVAALVPVRMRSPENPGAFLVTG